MTDPIDTTTIYVRLAPDAVRNYDEWSLTVSDAPGGFSYAEYWRPGWRTRLSVWWRDLRGLPVPSLVREALHDRYSARKAHRGDGT